MSFSFRFRERQVENFNNQSVGCLNKKRRYAKFRPPFESLQKKKVDRGCSYLGGDDVGYRLPEVEFINFTLSPVMFMLGQ